jgi:hypothetical protein
MIDGHMVLYLGLLMLLVILFGIVITARVAGHIPLTRGQRVLALLGSLWMVLCVVLIVLVGRGQLLGLILTALLMVAWEWAVIGPTVWPALCVANERSLNTARRF